MPPGPGWPSRGKAAEARALRLDCSGPWAAERGPIRNGSHERLGLAHLPRSRLQPGREPPPAGAAHMKGDRRVRHVLVGSPNHQWRQKGGSSSGSPTSAPGVPGRRGTAPAPGDDEAHRNRQASADPSGGTSATLSLISLPRLARQQHGCGAGSAPSQGSSSSSWINPSRSRARASSGRAASLWPLACRASVSRLAASTNGRKGRPPGSGSATPAA